MLSVLRAGDGTEESSFVEIGGILEERTLTRTSRYGCDIICVEPAAALEDGTTDHSKNHFTGRPDGYTPKVLVIHYTVCDFKTTLNVFCKTKDEVSAHFVISEESVRVPGGIIVECVPENMRAWHAGPSSWGDILCETRNGISRGLNSSSIGIELVNPGFVDDENGVRTWYPFCEKQIRSLCRLSAGIVKKWGIQPFNVVGHSDISECKSDPGVLFPWGMLHEYGVGAWLTESELNGKFAEGVVPREPLPQGVSESFFLCMLQEFGYTIPIFDTRKMDAQGERALSKFRIHYSANQKPERLNGSLDRDDMIWAYGLATKYPRS